MNKKSIALNEIFCGMPLLKKYFQDLDRKIFTLQSQKEGGAELERLERKRNELFAAATGLNAEDLQIVYYLRKIKRIFPAQLLHALQKFVEAQETLTEFMKTGEIKE